MGSRRPAPYVLLRDQFRDEYPDLPLSTIEQALDAACRAAIALDGSAGDRKFVVLARDRLDLARARARAALVTVRAGQEKAPA